VRFAGVFRQSQHQSDGDLQQSQTTSTSHGDGLITSLQEQIMRVLVLGGAGIVGASLVETAPAGSFVFLGYRRHVPMHRDNGLTLLVDCSDPASIELALDQVSPDVVVNAVGLNSIEECQKNPQLAYRSNVGSTMAILYALRGRCASLLHLSTNAVYDGLNAPYRESSPRYPVNVYGETKRLAEDIVCRQRGRQSIVRLSPLYGWSRSWSRLNPLSWIVDSLRAGNPLKLCDDIFDTPLSVEYAARTLWYLIAQDRRSQLNLGGGERVSRYQFGVAVAEAFGLDPNLIGPVASSFFKHLTARPIDSSFCTDRQVRVCPFPIPSLRDALAVCHAREPSPDDELVPGSMSKLSSRLIFDRTTSK